jgi:hypothetical protein
MYSAKRYGSWVEGNIVSYYGVVGSQLGNSGVKRVDRRYVEERRRETGVGSRNNPNNFRWRLLFCSRFYNWESDGRPLAVVKLPPF